MKNKRLAPKCTEEFRKRARCNMMDVFGCDYRTEHGYCGYFENFDDKLMLKIFDEVGKLEDKYDSKSEEKIFRNKIKEKSWDFGILYDFFIKAVSDTEEPIWTDEHIEELVDNFYVIPKERHEKARKDDSLLIG